jgi:hypothetical protein
LGAYEENTKVSNTFVNLYTIEQLHFPSVEFHLVICYYCYTSPPTLFALLCHLGVESKATAGEEEEEEEKSVEDDEREKDKNRRREEKECETKIYLRMGHTSQMLC